MSLEVPLILLLNVILGFTQQLMSKHLKLPMLQLEKRFFLFQEIA